MSNIPWNALPWEKARCRVPIFMMGGPAGFCGDTSFGHQLPSAVLRKERGWRPVDVPYCFGHCCPSHGGPQEGQPILFDDRLTNEGRQMWCAVMPGFINLQESEAEFSGDPNKAIAALKARATSAPDTEEK